MTKRTTVLLLSALALSGCADHPGTPGTPALTGPEPSLSPIGVYNGDGYRIGTIHRHCDGTTLLYVTNSDNYGVSAVPNSPLCGAE